MNGRPPPDRPMRPTPLRLALVAGVLAAAVVSACSEAPAQPTATLSVRAVYLGPQYGGEAMLVNHEAIPGRMPAMRMALQVYTPALLDSLREGAKVRLTLDSASLLVRDVDALPFETVLELDPGDENGRGGIVLPSVEE